MRGLKVPLSLTEEITLRRIAVGPSSDLPATDVARLRQLELIEPGQDVWRLTPLGHQRYAALSRPEPIDAMGRMLASFQGPNGREDG
jgi:hypothetical protein